MKKTYRNTKIAFQIEDIRKVNRWNDSNTTRMIYALMRIAEDPTHAKNIARNTLEDAGFYIDYTDE